jgi:hypothetical protein
MSSNQIPGIPEGWELVRIGVVHHGEWRLMDDGSIRQWLTIGPSTGWAVVLRKIEKPARYRHFANAEEFKPHRDRWWRYNDSEDSEHVQPPAAYSKIGPMGSNWEQAFMGRAFDDGTPFGVRIDE